MRTFLKELKYRNPLLYRFGWFNLLISILCIFLILADTAQVAGINRWIKPAKFYLSVGIVVWTLGWILYHLQSKAIIRICSWLIIVTLFFENAIILYQASRMKMSHFNNETAFDGLLFSLMGLLIFLFTCTVIYITVLFFRQKTVIHYSYCWGIRMGLILFIFFSAEGGIMISLLSHTVHGKDGGPGLPFLNWSTRAGDLRIAHFMGIHALQLIPLAGYYIFKTKKQVLLFSLTYFLAALALMLLALLGMPLIPVR